MILHTTDSSNIVPAFVQSVKSSSANLRRLVQTLVKDETNVERWVFDTIYIPASITEATNYLDSRLRNLLEAKRLYRRFLRSQYGYNIQQKKVISLRRQLDDRFYEILGAFGSNEFAIQILEKLYDANCPPVEAVLLWQISLIHLEQMSVSAYTILHLKMNDLLVSAIECCLSQQNSRLPERFQEYVPGAIYAALGSRCIERNSTRVRGIEGVFLALRRSTAHIIEQEKTRKDASLDLLRQSGFDVFDEDEHEKAERRLDLEFALAVFNNLSEEDRQTLLLDTLRISRVEKAKKIGITEKAYEMRLYRARRRKNDLLAALN